MVEGTRVCRRCSGLTEVAGDFCPACGARFDGRGRLQRMSHRRKVVAVAMIALFLLIAAGSGIAIKIRHDNAAQARQAQAQREAAARQAQQAEDAQQIALRHESERAMQASITKWARHQVDRSLLDGPILRTSCTPVGGGSENLADVTIKYECFAATTDNGDGTSDGYNVHATMDFNTGSYTWGLGN